jgi:hypothetical protein
MHSGYASHHAMASDRVIPNQSGSDLEAQVARDNGTSVPKALDSAAAVDGLTPRFRIRGSLVSD